VARTTAQLPALQTAQIPALATAQIEVIETRARVALSPAHPAKFPEAVGGALGLAPERRPKLEGLEGRAERFETVEPTLEAVLAAIRSR